MTVRIDRRDALKTLPHQYQGYEGYSDQYELYDLENDPEELEDLYRSRGSGAAGLRRELADKLQDVNQKGAGR